MQSLSEAMLDQAHFFCRYYVKKCAKPQKRAALALAVSIGSAVERDDEQGVAHIVEHLAFNATEVRHRYACIRPDTQDLLMCQSQASSKLASCVIILEQKLAGMPCCFTCMFCLLTMHNLWGLQDSLKPDTYHYMPAEICQS